MAEVGGLAESFRFLKSERIQSRADIDTVFSKGARFSVKGLRMHCVQRSDGVIRAVFVPVRKFGGSVRRNRAKRLVSEAYRVLKSGVSAGWDIVFVIYPGTDDFFERRRQVESVLIYGGLVKRNTCVKQ